MALEGKRILIVDDEPLILYSVKMMLSYDGHTVETANNANEALLAFEKGKFDLVITDYWMSGMKGDELARVIKEKAPRQPVILLTAHAQMIESLARDSTGGDVVVSKPFGHDVLVAAITQVLGAKDPAPT